MTRERWIAVLAGAVAGALASIIAARAPGGRELASTAGLLAFAAGFGVTLLIQARKGRRGGPGKQPRP